ncbi:MAG: DUF4870 domain-containing protein [Planctomycetes bacterium]|nr:DUF4870 domain-containing protein [Planctomycetota bacterium]
MSETPPAAPAPAPQADGSLKEDEKNWGMLAHMLSLTQWVGVPFGFWIGPLVAYLVKKDESKFVRFHAIQALGFNLAVFLVLVVISVPIGVLTFLSMGLFWLVAIPLYMLIIFGWIGYVIMIGIKASKGEDARYYYVGDWAYKKVYEEDWKPI